MRVMLVALLLLLGGCADPNAQVKRLLGEKVSPVAAEEEAYKMACAMAFLLSDRVQGSLRDSGVLGPDANALDLVAFMERAGEDAKSFLIQTHAQMTYAYNAQQTTCTLTERKWIFYRESGDLWIAGVQVEVEEGLTGKGIRFFAPCYEVRRDWGTVEELSLERCLTYWVQQQ